MRLVKQVARLEAAAAAMEPEAAEVGIAWTSAEERVEAAELAIGEYIALDVYVVEEVGGVPVWHTVERVTRESQDLGCVYRGRGTRARRVGRVVSVDGELVEWREEAAAD